MVNLTQSGREFWEINDYQRQYREGKIRFPNDYQEILETLDQIGQTDSDYKNTDPQEELSCYGYMEGVCLRGICTSSQWNDKVNWLRNLKKCQEQVDIIIEQNGLEGICLVI